MHTFPYNQAEPKESSPIKNISTYLGRPIYLPHSVSSPELPIPLSSVTCTSNAPVVTFHSVPLASPTNKSPSDPSRTVADTSRSSTLFDRQDHRKAHGYRSQFEFILPDIEVTGELETRSHTHESSSISITKTTTTRLVRSPVVQVNNDHTSDSDPTQNTCQSSQAYPENTTNSSWPMGILAGQRNERRRDLEVPKITVENECIGNSYASLDEPNLFLPPRGFLCPAVDDVEEKKKTADGSNKRSRSLSPCLSRCLCYNCNVSELIMRSVDLPASERSNFNVYFARSLSHKFSNCSCYALAALWQAESASRCSLCSEEEGEGNEGLRKKRSAKKEFNRYFKHRNFDDKITTEEVGREKSVSCPNLSSLERLTRCPSSNHRGKEQYAGFPPLSSSRNSQNDPTNRLRSHSLSIERNNSSIINDIRNDNNNHLGRQRRRCKSETDLEGRFTGLISNLFTPDGTLDRYNPEQHFHRHTPSILCECKSHEFHFNHHSTLDNCYSSIFDRLFNVRSKDNNRRRRSCSDGNLEQSKSTMRNLNVHNSTLDHRVSFSVGSGSSNNSSHQIVHDPSSFLYPSQRSNEFNTVSTTYVNDSSSSFCRGNNLNRHSGHHINNSNNNNNNNNNNSHNHHRHSPKCPRSLSRQSIPQPQRSFSSPDTRPTIIQPDPTCTARRHRHGISGQMSYFKLLGYNVSKKLTGSANSLFSTAVISGSSSAPNLKDMVPPHASAVAAIEGFGGVPPIRPLETLHNALSLRQLDSFLEMMTSAPLFRTPASSPPKYSSPNGFCQEAGNRNLGMGGNGREYHSSDMEAVRYREKISKPPLYISPMPMPETCDSRNQPSPTSPNSAGWSSEPQSFQSSEPSSPAPTSTGECSMSISLISNDGTNQPFNNTGKYSTTPTLDLDFNDFCVNMDQHGREARGSISYTDYYSNEEGQIRRSTQYGAYASNFSKMAGEDSIETVPDEDQDEDHTLTLRQNEEQKKQDVKLIFDQKENSDTVKSSSNNGAGFKTIGRFRVESMEISDEDVRIKESGTWDKSAKPSSQAQAEPTSSKSQKTAEFERVQQESTKKFVKSSLSTMKKKHLSRSKSVSTPKTTSSAFSDIGSSFKCSIPSSVQADNWRFNTTESSFPTRTTSEGGGRSGQEGPILTLASSLKGSSSITIGFNIQDTKQ